MYPLDPHGVKKWGGYDPPSSYGCAAHDKLSKTKTVKLLSAKELLTKNFNIN